MSHWEFKILVYMNAIQKVQNLIAPTEVNGIFISNK